MFKIGDFSRIARVSCRLLRYYDELGLSLDQIGRAIGKTLSADELRAMLLIRRADVEHALAAETDRLRQIETRISQIDTEGQLPVDDVLIRSEPARHVLTRRQTVQSFAEGRGAIQQLAQSLPRRLSSRLGPLIAIAHSSEFEPDSIDIEYGFALNDGAERAQLAVDVAGLQLRELPAVQHMAVCVRIGLPEHAHLITARIGQFVERNGYALAGPSREVFLQPPEPARMEQSVVEMQYPVESLR
jgi:DNA-binding transcriptional MerR regulator